MRNRGVFSICFLLSILSVASAQRLPASYVDPFIGSGAHGHVFVGASVPFGAVQVGPDNIVKGWDWCSGYHYSDSVVIGFSQTHLSGTGIGDLGDISLMPYTGTVRTEPGTQEHPTLGYGSHYSHAGEEAEPGYYRVQLEDYRIRVELTATERVGFHKYIFPKGEEGHVTIDLEHGIGWDRSVDTYIRKLNDSTLVGYRFSSGWAPDQRLWFAIVTNRPVDAVLLFDSTAQLNGDSARGRKIKAVLSLGKSGGSVLYKVGISPVSSENALANIRAELPGWNFEAVAANARRQWNKALGRIQYRSPSEKLKKIFYTALYHSMIQPSLFNDADNSYRGTDKKVYPDPGFGNYSVFSLWDTYRALHPLLTVVQPERVNDFIRSMLAIYQQQGKLPIWPLDGNETNCMVGYPAVMVIADAYLKGFDGFDANLALEAMKASANRDDYGMQYIKKLGYIPADKEEESVSKALEYAIGDYSIAMMAQKMGRQEDYEFYLKRAQLYNKYFDSSSHFMRGIMSDGSFRTPFHPAMFDNKAHDYTEGVAWQYSWLVPQDVYGLIARMGGEKAFTEKLDSLFILKEDLGPDAPPDISGMIGLYAQGNEPNHHIPYLYVYAGQPWKTADKVREIMETMYTDQPDGLCGNDDSGQMSAWYVLSAMGLYPVNTADGKFVFGSPLMNSATIKTGKKPFVITAVNNSAKNKYIQRVILNGKPYGKTFIAYEDIMKGGSLQFIMGATPGKTYGMATDSRP